MDGQPQTAIHKIVPIWDDRPRTQVRAEPVHALRLLDECVAPNLGGNLAFMGPFGRARASRQLKHRGMLSCTQTCQQNHLAAREFQRVVVLVRIVQIDLPEPSHVFPQLLVREEPERVIALDIAVEDQLSSG